jgi:hypothetical protein
MPIPVDYCDFILQFLPYLNRESISGDFQAYLGQNPPVRPADPLPNMNPEGKIRQYKLIDIYKKPLLQLLNILKLCAADTGWDILIDPYLQNNNAIGAIAAIRAALMRNTGKNSEKEVLTAYFDTYVLSGKFKDLNSLELDLNYATNMIANANNSLTVGVPFPPHHNHNLPHPNALTNDEKISFLRKLITPLTRFKDVLLSILHAPNEYEAYVQEIRNTISNFNVYRAYSGNQITAAEAKIENNKNEIHESAAAAINTNYKRRRSNSQSSNQSNNSNFSNNSRNFNNYNHRKYTNRKHENFSNDKPYHQQQKDRSDKFRNDFYNNRRSSDRSYSPHRSTSPYRSNSQSRPYQRSYSSQQHSTNSNTSNSPHRSYSPSHYTSQHHRYPRSHSSNYSSFNNHPNTYQRGYRQHYANPAHLPVQYVPVPIPVPTSQFNTSTIPNNPFPFPHSFTSQPQSSPPNAFSAYSSNFSNPFNNPFNHNHSDT